MLVGAGARGREASQPVEQGPARSTNLNKVAVGHSCRVRLTIQLAQKRVLPSTATLEEHAKWAQHGVSEDQKQGITWISHEHELNLRSCVPSRRGTLVRVGHSAMGQAWLSPFLSYLKPACALSSSSFWPIQVRSPAAPPPAHVSRCWWPSVVWYPIRVNDPSGGDSPSRPTACPPGLQCECGERCSASQLPGYPAPPCGPWMSV